jgi:hypothetical protein
LFPARAREKWKECEMRKENGNFCRSHKVLLGIGPSLGLIIA